MAVSAGDDTTAHTLAWPPSHVAQQPEFLSRRRRIAVINEVLRLYPAGLGGQPARCKAHVEFGRTTSRRGTLVRSTPPPTHRDPGLWTDPLSFRPDRFEHGAAAWGFIPFAAGERTCLAAEFAHRC